MSAQDTLHKMIEAFNRHDADTFAALHTTDAVVHDPQHTDPLYGKEAIRKDAADFFVSFPDIKATVLNIIANGNALAGEVEMQGTNEGPIVTPDGDLPGTNRRVVIRVGTFLQVDQSGLITDNRRYFDMAGLLHQLGLE